MTARKVSLAAVGATCPLALGCSAAAPSLPGTSLGTYAVTGNMEANTCGAGLNAPNPWTFSAQMSEDGATLYWLMSDGSEVSNTMTSGTQVTLTSAETANVDATEAGPGSCDLTSTSTIALTLASASAPSAFRGTITYQFFASTGVASTNDCTDQLTASGGMYDTLPCTVSYSLSGAVQ